MHNTITLEQAYRKVDHYIEEGRKALSPQAKLVDPFHLAFHDVPCDNIPGTSEAERSYQIVGVPTDDPASYYAAIRKWWKAHNFRVTHDDVNAGFLTAENTDDHFDMGLQHNDRGELYLSVDSPCVWPHGTPEPQPPS